MSLLRTRIRLVRETNRLYRDHYGSVSMFVRHRGDEGVDLTEINESREQAIQEIIDATTLDNTE